jgi:hypothetical protein
MKSKRNGTPRRPASSAKEEAPALPVWKAFVVQFSRETTAKTGTFSGRVEHLSSGRRARFATTAELLAVLWKMLGELGEAGDSTQ